MVDIEAFDDEEKGNEDESGANGLNYDSMDIQQIKFVNQQRLAILTRLKYDNSNQKPISCLLTINLNKIIQDLDFQDNVIMFNEYEMGINEQIFSNYDIIPCNININDINKYLFSSDVDGQELSISGSRKLAAITCDPCMDNSKCNRLIVLDINVDDDEDEEEDEDEETEDELNENGKNNGNDKEEMDDIDESYSSGNEDSDLRKIVDID